MASSIELLLQHAKLADRYEHYHDMAAAMKAVVKKGLLLNQEERQLLSRSYKKLVVGLRASLRNTRFRNRNPEERRSVLSFRATIKCELYQICYEVLNLVRKYLLPTAVRPEEKVFYMTMWADYCQCLAEIVTGDLRVELAASSEEIYKEAFKIARTHLTAVNPLRLKLARSFSLLYMNVLDWPSRAVQVAQNAFDEAVEVLLNVAAANRFDGITMHSLRSQLMISVRSYQDDSD